ncbi:hypothetical protein [Spiroplasma endosymbiont of Cantharis nigra]|uniref:hypothetical protein n=1 Tax=Spiroplasma endosymbiont of Cantharis nigra TaxID=3066278 RepID=UPI0030D4746C
MSEKVYQLSSNQLGIVKFKEPWLLIHLELEGELESIQYFYPTLDEGIKKFALIFEKKIINFWFSKGNEGKIKIDKLKEYLLTSWINPGVETMKELLIQNYDYFEFNQKTSKELIEENHRFLALTIIHICLNHNKNHFYFNGLHVSTKFVDKMLAVDFWSKVEQESLEDNNKI